VTNDTGLKLGWSFFGLIVVVMLSYGLTRGLYVGSTTQYNAGVGANTAYYSYHCKYLYADRVSSVEVPVQRRRRPR